MLTGHSDHTHNSDDFFEQLIREAENARSRGREEIPLSSDEQLTDNYQQQDAKIRFQSITAILRKYEYAYSNKVTFQEKYRKLLFFGCGGIIVLFSLAALFVIGYTIKNAASLDLTGMSAIITVTLSLVISILGLVNTITKYCFPENDEEHVVNIVRSVQENDLERLKEVNRAAEARGRDEQGPDMG